MRTNSLSQVESMGDSLPYTANYENQAVAQVGHSLSEIMAQSICTAISGGTPGWIFAVRRKCSSTAGSCAAICTVKNLNENTKNRKMFASGAIHVYENRPSSNIPGTAAGAKAGLMVYRHNNIYRNNCGPNYCCCFVPGA